MIGLDARTLARLAWIEQQLTDYGGVVAGKLVQNWAP